MRYSRLLGETRARHRPPGLPLSSGSGGQSAAAATNGRGRELRDGERRGVAVAVACLRRADGSWVVLKRRPLAGKGAVCLSLRAQIGSALASNRNG